MSVDVFVEYSMYNEVVQLCNSERFTFWMKNTDFGLRFCSSMSIMAKAWVFSMHLKKFENPQKKKLKLSTSLINFFSRFLFTINLRRSQLFN